MRVRIISFGFLFLMTYTLANGLGYDGTRWVKISSSREGKSLRNTFPFSETAHHGHHDEHHHDHHHHHHEESGSLNSKHHNAGFSLPGTSFSPPALDSRASRQRGNQGGDDVSLDIGSIAAAGERCIDKVIMTQETEYDDVITCKHSYSEKCHTTYATDYEPTQEEKCEENFKKNCFIEFKPKASEEQVQFCYTPLVKNCDIPGPEVCTTEYTSACTTRYHEHTVDDDSVECETIVEEKCEDVTQGYTTSQDCTKWPVTKCGDVKTESTKKYSPETECKKVPIELCGPGSCPVEPGPEECHERTQTIVQEVPEETCNLEPQRICKHVTKLVPRLKARENCIDIPKEVCSRSRTNPRTIQKPIIKKWCYTPSGTPPKPPAPKPPVTTTNPPPNNQGSSERPPITTEPPSIDINKRCKRRSPACDTSNIREDPNNPGQVDQTLLCQAPDCQYTECGWLGGECQTEKPPTPRIPDNTYLPPKPKDTYLPPKKGY